MDVQALQELGIGLFVSTLMLSVGLDLSLDRFKALRKNPASVGVGLLVNYAAVPIGLWLLCTMLGVSTPVKAGIMLCGIAPGGPLGALFTQRLEGELALATALVVGMNFANTLATPALAALWGIAPQGSDTVPVWPMVRTIVFFQVLPLVVGMVWRARSASTAAKLSPWTRRAANFMLAASILGFLLFQGQKALELEWSGALAIVLGVFMSQAMGWWIAPRQLVVRRALCMVTAFRSMSVILLIAAAWYPDPRTLLAALGYSTGMFWLSLGLIGVLKWRDRRRGSTPGPQLGAPQP